MKKGTWISSLIFGLVAAAFVNAGTGKYYGVFWDGSAEHFGSFSPYTSTTTDLGLIPDVKWIASGNAAFDSDCDRYVFIGGPSTGAMSYYVIDARTGDVLSTSPRAENIIQIAYSSKDKTYYGLFWDGSAENFVSIDPFTSEMTVMDVIPDVKWVAALNYTFNPDCNQYMFIGGATTSAMSYYVIDARTGAVVSQSPLGGKVDGIAYSPADHAYHGVWWDGTAEHIGILDPATSETTDQGTVPGVKLISVGGYAFDTDCNRYVLVGGGSTSAMNYSVLDGNDGSVISQRPVAGKIDNIKYGGKSTREEDEEEDAVLTAEAEAAAAAADAVTAVKSHDPLKTSFSVHPDFTGKAITLDIGNGNGGRFSFLMHDMSGKSVVKVEGLGSGHARIGVNGLTKGIYFYQIRDGHTVAGAGKLVME